MPIKLGNGTCIWNALSATFTKQRFMAAWEYKVITSGKGGFATPALLEKFLNDLGREEWEIVEFRSSPDNVLAFTGLARRSTQRDWTLEDAAAAAARAEAEKLRAEFAAKFQGLTAAASGAGQPGQPQTPSALAAEEKDEKGEFRRPVDTSHDLDPDAPDEEEKDEWDELAEEDELPTFFDALKPHMRRNQRGPGMAVGVDYLAKKWDLSEDDIKGALLECGFELPEDEDTKPAYLEYDGDLYWLNVNRRGELWINTKEKPRPMFRTVKAERAQIEEEPARETRGGREGREGGKSAASGHGAPKGEAEGAENAAATGEGNGHGGEAAPAGEPVPLPEGPALLDKIRPQMRRNRRGPGGSGSVSFLTRALRCSEADLLGAFGKLGLVVPESAADKPAYTEIGNEVWWINRDSRGGIWINGREKRAGETIAPREGEPATEGGTAAEAVSPAATPPPAGEAEAVPPPPTLDTVPSAEPASVPAASAGASGEPGGTAGHPLAAVRLLLKETRTGSVAGKVDRVAADLGKSPEELTATLVAAGLKVPEKAREKPVFVEHGGEIFWFNLNGKGELWVNAKASKFAGESEGEAEAAASGERKPRSRGRGRGSRAKSESSASRTDASESEAGSDAGSAAGEGDAGAQSE